MNARPLVMYHKDCADGFCAAWVARRKLGDCEFLPMHYGDTPPDVDGREVYVLDFSFSLEVVADMISKARKFVLLDHHQTAQEELRCVLQWREDVVINVMDNISGGRMAWNYFFPGDLSPWLVDYTEDRDLWRFALVDSKEANAALRAYEFEFDLWDSWGFIGDGWCVRTFPPSTLIEQGEGIVRYQEQMVKKLVATSREVDIGGHKVMAANTPVLISEVASELAKGRPFGACWFVLADGKVQTSLRSDNDGLDVSVIAKAHGGGGHKHAAGFEV